MHIVPGRRSIYHDRTMPMKWPCWVLAITHQMRRKGILYKYKRKSLKMLITQVLVVPHHLSIMPSPLAVSLLGGGDVVPLPRREPSLASRSRKSDHNSANDSLLLELLAMSMGSLKPLLSDGVDGVRRKGDMGRRRLLLEAPGRARPACSRCSGYVSFKMLHVDHRAYHLSSLAMQLSAAMPQTSSGPIGQWRGNAESSL
jgi:hypothetical protein